jgi:serine/threonine-protein kinase RsbW
MPTKLFPGQFSSLAEISEFVGLAAEAAGFDSKDVYAVKLAVDEACTNIIEHGYGGEGIGNIECSYHYDANCITIELRDWGTEFCPGDVPDPDYSVPLEELQLRGAGLFLMRKLMDDVRFSFNNEGGNLLVLVKKKMMVDLTPYPVGL